MLEFLNFYFLPNKLSAMGTGGINFASTVQLEEIVVDCNHEDKVVFEVGALDCKPDLVHWTNQVLAILFY